MPGEAIMLCTSGCPAINGSKGTLSAVSPGHPAVRCASDVFTGMDKTVRTAVRTFFPQMAGVM